MSRFNSQVTAPEKTTRPFINSTTLLILFILFTFTLNSCSSGDDSSGTQYNIGGTISDATGPLILRNNGSDPTTINVGTSPFVLTTQVADSTTYSVTVDTPPDGQTCTVQNGSGTVNGAM